uniref:hypothetical protein n=1 Tax=Halorussus pelagicus TaxID=2505977 RepID=UPI000FFB31E4|nr:hypothetical protein [Halorussus pelagicus]
MESELPSESDGESNAVLAGAVPRVITADVLPLVDMPTVSVSLGATDTSLSAEATDAGFWTVVGAVGADATAPGERASSNANITGVNRIRTRTRRPMIKISPEL